MGGRWPDRLSMKGADARGAMIIEVAIAWFLGLIAD